MAYRVTPQVEVLCYPRTAIPQKGSQFFSADRLGELVFAGAGASGVGGVTGGQATAVSWADQWQFTTLSGVEFIRFLKDKRVLFGASRPPDGTKSEERDIAGFCLSGRRADLDCQIGDNAGQLDGGYTDLNWTAATGTWKTVKPPLQGLSTSILNRGDDSAARAYTTGTIPANRSFMFDVHFAAHDPNGAEPIYTFSWGAEGEGRYALAAKHNYNWSLAQLRNGTWVIVEEFPFRANLHGGHYWIAVRRYGGRLVVSFHLNQGGVAEHFWVAGRSMPASGGAGRRPTPRDITWSEGQLAIDLINVKARTGVAMWKYSSPNGTPYSGTIARSLNRTSYLPESAAFQIEVAPKARYGCSITPSATVETNAVNYKLILRANADGIDTPLVDKVLVRRAPEHTAPSQSSIDIWPAVSRLSIRKALPPLSCGDELSLELDRDALAMISGSWENYVKDFCPVTVRVRWQNDDLSTTSWETPFKGFLYGLRKTSGGIANNRMSVTGRDNLVRLQKPAAIIDHHVPPLDWWFATMFEIVPGELEPNGKFYAAQGIKEIVRMFLGDNEANELNGNGNALRYLPSGHPPLLTTQQDAVGWYELQAISGAANGYNTPPPMKGGFYFPPPFREDAWYWIQQLAKDDQCVCYRGWAGNDASGGPALLYGRPLSIIANRTLRRVTDNNYINGDLNKLLLGAEVETRPDKDINRILVMSRPLSGGLEALAPALEVAESQIAPPDGAAAVYTWVRSLLVSDDIAVLPGVAQIIADQLLAQLAGVNRVWPTLTVRGEANYQYGDAVTVVMSGTTSDASLGLDGLTFRVEPVTHEFNKGKAGIGFRTTLGVRPLTTAEDAAI